MGHAKLEQTPDVAALRRAAEPVPPHGDEVAEAILDMALDYDDDRPVAGIRNAAIVGVAFWMLLGLGAFLLV